MARTGMNGEEVDVAIVGLADDGVDEVHRPPQVLVDPDLDADTAPLGTVDITLLAYVPAVVCQTLSRLDDHVTDKLALLHERGTESLGAGPGLGAAAVEVDAVHIGGG